MTTVLITAPKLADEAMTMLAERGARVETMPLTATAQEMAERVAALQPDGIISRTVRIDAGAIGAARRLRAISKHGTGVDNIDLEAASRRGIPVAFTPGANAQSVAEHAAAMMLALARHLPFFVQSMAATRWERTSVLGTELSGRILGLVGFGAIARRFAHIGEGIGMRVHAFDPYLGSAQREGVMVHDRLDSLLEVADVLSLHCPLTDATRGLIGAAAFGRMKRGALLINAARGPIVDEPALISALRDGEIAGAGLDTFASEPLPPDSPLRGMDNVVLTPHVGASTVDAARRMSVQSVENLFDMLEGRPIAPERLANAAELRLE